MSSAMNLPVLLGEQTVTGIIEAVKNLPIMKAEDVGFLQENSKHLAAVLENTHMWRTDAQKVSIINDYHFPTVHAKFHQAMLEQKVQFDQAMYLAKDFEMKKLEIQELECDLEELGDSKRDNIKRARISIDIQFKQYELKQMQIAMKYRMDEVKGWQKIETDLLAQMRGAGMSEEEIWSKNEGEASSMFFAAMNNLQALPHTTDSAERGNLISLAVHSYKTAKQAGLLEKFKSDATTGQLEAIKFVEERVLK